MGCPEEHNGLSFAPPRPGGCNPVYEDTYWSSMIKQLKPETQYSFIVTSLY